MSFFHTIVTPQSMIYNPTNSTHRGRVIETNQRGYQLEQARKQATLKVENETTNLNTGTQATAIANMNGAGTQIQSVTVTNPGSGYKFPPLITFEDNSQLAQAEAVIDGREIVGLTLTSTGSNYLFPPIVVITGGGGTGATGHTTIVAGSVNSLVLDTPGSGYTSTPDVFLQNTVADTQGGGAQATATVGTGAVTQINVTVPGKGYLNPVVTIVGINNTANAFASATVVGGNITAITVDNGGAGYITVPNVVITDDNIAVANSVINSSGEVTAINVTQSGRGYTIQPQVRVADPSTPPTLDQREELYNKYLKEFLNGIGMPFDIINAYFAQGQVRRAQFTGSASTITNPFWVPGGAGGPNAAGTRTIETIVPCPHEMEITVPDEPKGCFHSIVNDGKAPVQEDRYTHKMRKNRNSSASYIIQQANQAVEKQVNNIVKNGGNGAIILANPHPSNGTIIGFTIQNGGQYYTTNPPTVVISRIDSDPGKAKATVTLDINGYIDTFTITNPTTNTGYTQSTPPDIYIANVKTTAVVTIAGGRVTAISLTSSYNTVSFSAPPNIEIVRTNDDAGKAQAVVATVDANGSITSFTITNAGTGYDPNYKPEVSVFGGRGHVSPSQKQDLLDNYLIGAFDHLKPNFGEKPPTIKSSGYSTLNSSSIVENSRFLNIIDVTDPLTRKQRQNYIKKESVIDAKARESALARYNKAVQLGNIPNTPAIPPPPEPPKVNITGSSGSGAILEAQVDFEGKVTSFIIVSGGSGYPDSPPTLNFTTAVGDNGFGASAMPIIENGTVTDVEMLFGGYDYFIEPIVTISSGTATFSSIIDSLTLKVTDVTVTGPGSNYLSIDLTGAGGSGFKGLLVTENGVITGVIIQDTGSGFDVQQPPNSIYLQYLRDAQSVVKTNEPPGPGESPPPSNRLPEPTLQDNPKNLAVRKLNEQKRSAKRASSTVITVAIDARLEAKQTYQVWKANQTLSNKLLAQQAYNKAQKATQAAYQLQRWLPNPSDTSLKHRNEIFP